MATTKGSLTAESMGKRITKALAPLRKQFAGGISAVVSDHVQSEDLAKFELIFRSAEDIKCPQKAVLMNFLFSDETKAVIQAYVKVFGWKTFRLSSRSVSAKHPSKEYVWSIIKIK